jgi:hypothetical protein
MSDPNSAFRRPTSGRESLNQLIRGVSSLGRQQDILYEVRVGERWSQSAKSMLNIISGCYTLHKKSAKWFHETFPNAAIFGFFGSAPGNKGNLYKKFVERLPNNLDVDSQRDVKTIIDAW